MSNRPQAVDCSGGRELRRLGLGASALATLLIGASIETRADTIRLKSGEEIEGSIIDATRNTAIVRRSIGGMRQMRIDDIDEVRIDLVRGKEISGQFLGWADGAYQLRSGGEQVWVSEGVISDRETRQATAQHAEDPVPGNEQDPTAVTAELGPEQPAAVATASEPKGAPDAMTEAESEQGQTEFTMTSESGQESAKVTTRSEPEQETAALAPTASAVAAPEETAASNAEGEGQTVAVKGSAAPASSDPDGMVFKIELSRAAKQPVVLIYGTLDGTAKAGTDYQSQQGVITLAPGSKSGEVRVPLLEPRPSNGAKQFELFLIADPKVAEVVDKRIIATIEGGE
jgi:hypothetical protein